MKIYIVNKIMNLIFIKIFFSENKSGKILSNIIMGIGLYIKSNLFSYIVVLKNFRKRNILGVRNGFILYYRCNKYILRNIVIFFRR